MKHIALIAVLPLLLSLSGCGGAELKTSNNTMGQELLDLGAGIQAAEEAYSEGRVLRRDRFSAARLPSPG